MKGKMKYLEYVKFIIKKNSFVNLVAARLYYFFKFNKYNIIGKNNHIDRTKAFLNKCSIIITGNNNTIHIEEKAVLRNCNIRISGNSNKIFIGKLVNAINLEIHLEDDFNVVKIGDKTKVNGRTHIACIEGTTVEIGKECLLSSEIVLRTGDSHSIINMDGKRINQSKDIIIKNHVWIGHRVLINKGVKLNENSVIATGSIVTKDFDEKNVVIAGIPAIIIKHQINWDIKRFM